MSISNTSFTIIYFFKIDFPIINFSRSAEKIIVHVLRTQSSKNDKAADKGNKIESPRGKLALFPMYYCFHMICLILLSNKNLI